jgi:four helix bundle protein
MAQQSNFRSLDLAIAFLHSCERVKAPTFLKDQLLRAASSVALNLTEGYGKPTPKDRRKFFDIAYGSARECKTALLLAHAGDAALLDRADHLCAALYKLSRAQGRVSR